MKAHQPSSQLAMSRLLLFYPSLTSELKFIAVIAAVYNIFCNFAAEETECDRLTFTGFMTLHSSVQSILKALQTGLSDHATLTKRGATA